MTDSEKEIINQLELIRQKNKEGLDLAKFHWNSLANQRLFEVSKNLIAIASISIPIVLIPVATKEIGNLLSNFDKTMLAIALVLLLSSLAFAILHIRGESEFFHEWAETESKRSGIFSSSIISKDITKTFRRLIEMQNESDKLRKNLKLQSSLFNLYAQAACIGVGILLIIFVTLKLIIKY